jgi:hypothetical protein
MSFIFGESDVPKQSNELVALRRTGPGRQQRRR